MGGGGIVEGSLKGSTRAKEGFYPNLPGPGVLANDPSTTQHPEQTSYDSKAVSLEKLRRKHQHILRSEYVTTVDDIIPALPG